MSLYAGLMVGMYDSLANCKRGVSEVGYAKLQVTASHCEKQGGVP